jgi:hypothetical protein
MIGWLMNMEKFVEWELVGEPKYLDKTCPIATLTWHRIEPGPLSWEAATNRLSYSMVTRFS